MRSAISEDCLDQIIIIITTTRIITMELTISNIPNLISKHKALNNISQIKVQITFNKMELHNRDVINHRIHSKIQCKNEMTGR